MRNNSLQQWLRKRIYMDLRIYVEEEKYMALMCTQHAHNDVTKITIIGHIHKTNRTIFFKYIFETTIYANL